MDIDGSTELVGIIGDPVSHSLSPRIHNAAYRAMKMNLVYVPLHVSPPDLPVAIAGLRAMNYLGANVTIPHKIEVAGLMDDLDESASITGAVNTIKNINGSLAGYNTDGEGFIMALEEKTSPDYSEIRVLLFGAGGAARSVGAALAGNGVPSITIVNRSHERAVEFQSMLIKNFPAIIVDIRKPDDLDEDLVQSHKLIINATPKGMKADLKPLYLPVDKLSKGHLVCDLVYVESGLTPLEVQAQEKGADTMGGLGMLLHQGAAAIRLWTGKKPPIEAMRHAIESERTDNQEES